MLMYLSHMYQDQADLEPMIALLLAVRPPAWLLDYPTPDDLREMLANSDIRKHTRLWSASDNSLQGWALVSNYGNIRFEMLSEHYQSGLADEMLNFGIETSQQLELPSLATNCRLDDQARIELLQKHDFQMQSTRSVFLLRSLDTLPAPVSLPTDYQIVACSGY